MSKRAEDVSVAMDIKARSTERPSGRVAFDDRGNSVWEWQTATGVFKRDIDSGELARLENPNLSLADTWSGPSPRFEGQWIYDVAEPVKNKRG
jgi:hypothetical protein